MKKVMMKNNQILGENSPFKKITVTITGKEPKKVYSKISPYYGNAYFKLKTVTEENKPKNIFVYPNDIEKGKFQQITNLLPNTWYSLFVKRKGNRWILHNWKELTTYEKK